MNPVHIARAGSPARRRRSAAVHAIALAAFAGVTVVWLWPLIGHWRTAIPGPGPGDNVVFVWNVWWTRYAILHGLSPLHTPMLLYPFGADLTLHTLTLLPALAVSFVSNPVAAQNALIAAHLFLNFAVAYALAFALTRSVAASIAAALAFGWSPYIGAHLAGHFNLIAAWVLPLAALMAVRVHDRRSPGRGAALGAVLGLTAYVDYYYFVYAVLLAGILLCAPAVRMRRASSRPIRVGRIVIGLGALAGVAAFAAVAIVVSGGGALHVGRTTISMRSAWNPAAIGWLAALAAIVLAAAASVRISVYGAAVSRLRRPVGIAALVLVVALSPLLVAAVRLALSAGYVSQPYLWRSAPAGVDLLSLFAGNPSSVVYGGLAGEAYRHAGIDAVERVAWLSPALLVLAVFGIRASGSRAWIVALVVFGLWALGPNLHAAGHASPFWLPAVAVRWLPIVANARIPARAMIVVYLACAMLAALGVERLLRSRRTVLVAVAMLLLGVDLAPRAPPVTTLPHPAVLDVIRSSPDRRAVLDVPFGLRDGFGETGRLDPLAMWFQTIHERPIAGGFVARLPPGIVERYSSISAFREFLTLSGSGAPGRDAISPARSEAAADLAAVGIGYVLLDARADRRTAYAYVRSMPALEPVGADGEVALYRVKP